MTPQRKIEAWGLLLVVVLVMAMASARSSGWFEVYEAPLRDARYKFRSQRDDASKVALVVVDATTLKEVNVPYSLWSGLRAKVVENLVSSGAKVVALDLLWQFDPDSVLAFGEEFTAVAEMLGLAERQMAMATIQGPVVLGCFYDGKDVSTPRPLLTGAAGDRLALLNLNEAEDGCIRQLDSTLSLQSQLWPCLAYRAAVLAGGSETDQEYWIDYRGPSGSFPTFSFSEFLGDDLDPDLVEQIRDKVVLVGSYDPRLGDRHRSPFSGSGEADMYGLEVHANGVETLLRGNLIKSLSGLGETLVSLVLALAGLFIVSRLRISRAIISAFIVLGLVVSGSFLSFSKLGLWVSLWDKIVLFVLVCFGALVLRYYFVDRQRRRMRRAFERYVPFSVNDELFEIPDALEIGGKPREVTVLFSDVTNFSTTSEQVTPKELMGLINEYFREMTEIIYAHGGTIRQFVGDEIMVIFGAPTASENHAQRAIDTAAAMERRLNELKKERAGQLGFYENKIGLHTGEVVCGNVGSDLRMEYTAVGDNVNIGSRIMGLNKNFGTKILFSKDTLDRANCEAYKVRSLGLHKVRGRESEIEIFELQV